MLTQDNLADLLHVLSFEKRDRFIARHLVLLCWK